MRKQFNTIKFIDSFLDKYHEINPMSFLINKENILEYIKLHKDRSSLPEIEQMKISWYDSIKNNNPNYDIYSSEEYILETVGGYIIYSRKFIAESAKYLSDDKDIKRILDLGNGIGSSSELLSELYPGREVFGTNYPEGIQWFNTYLK